MATVSPWFTDSSAPSSIVSAPSGPLTVRVTPEALMTGVSSRNSRILSILFLCLVLLWVPSLASARALLVVGDSLSAAYNMPEEAGWVALLEDRLRSEMATPPKVINAAISGETTAGGLSRLPPLLAEHEPGLVVIALGGNDGLRGLPPAQIRDNLARMIALSGEAGAKVVLVGIDIPPNYGAAYRQRFRAVFEELAEANGLPLLPFFLEGVALEEGMMQADGIHPTVEAQPRLLENLWPLLAAALDVD